MLTPRSWLFALAALVLAGPAPAASGAEDHPAVATVKSKVKDPARPFALLVTLQAKAGKEKELEAAFAPCIAASKKEAGCLAYELNRDPDAPTTYVLFEKWKDVASLAAHLKAGHTQELFKAIGPLTDGETKAKVYLVPE
jgi:quinol monooxygenase YgiN